MRLSGKGLIATRAISAGECIVSDLPLVCATNEPSREHCTFCYRWLRDPLDPDTADQLISELLDKHGAALHEQLAPHGISPDKLRQLLKDQAVKSKLARDDPQAGHQQKQDGSARWLQYENSGAKYQRELPPVQLTKCQLCNRGARAKLNLDDHRLRSAGSDAGIDVAEDSPLQLCEVSSRGFAMDSVLAAVLALAAVLLADVPREAWLRWHSLICLGRFAAQQCART